MADSSKVRLVRCPKCENLLPELPGYSVYQCGGCGAVLRAKKSDSEEVKVSVRFDEEIVPEKSDILSSKSEDIPLESVSGGVNRAVVVSDRSNEPGANSHGNVLSNIKLESGADKPKSRVEEAIKLRNSDVFVNQNKSEGGEFDGSSRIRRIDPGEAKFRPLNYHGEGTSRYFFDGSTQRNAALMKNQAGASNFNGDERIRPNRDELLRQLDELKEQLSMACDVNEKHKEKDPVDPRMYGPDSFVESDHWHHRGPRQQCASDQYHEPYGSYLPKAEMSMSDYRISGYENPYGSCLYARPLRHPGSHTHMFEPHLYNNPGLSQSSCSCRQCYHKYSQIPTQIPYRRYSLASNNPVPFHHDNQGRFASNLGGFSRPQRVVLTESGRSCRPMAGGAPFVTCHNCFELLELPKKVPMLDNNGWKIRCGGCSSLISFAMVDEKLVVVDPAPKQTLVESFDSSGEVLLDRPYDPHGGMRRDNVGFHSEEDYDNLRYDFRSMEKEPEELQNPNLLSSSTSEDEVCARGSPLQGHFGYSSKFRAVNRCGKGSLSSRSDQERVLPSKSVVRQNSLKDSMATELDISHHDYGNNEVSNDTSGEEDLPKGRRGVDSFLAGIIKKSFRDFKSSQSAENGKRSVFVNGRLVPDRSVKKAEKLAGPISPGQYWYDYTAGFWGVMGGPCLGIIPPHIEEFNYPMPRNCAAGKTSVVVNGRELHENDLALLASRGLPLTKDRSYVVEISGKVVDKDSGEERDSLGKLAPTIEKVKHGFGMRVPKSVS